MNDVQFREEIISKVSNLERDLAFVRGVIEGADKKNTDTKERASLYISCISLTASIILVVSKVLGW